MSDVLKYAAGVLLVWALAVWGYGWIAPLVMIEGALLICMCSALVRMAYTSSHSTQPPQ